MTLTQGQGSVIDKQKIACLNDKVRTTHPIITKRGGFIALIIVIIWLDFAWNWYFSKFTDVLFMVKHYFGHISGIGMVVPIDVKRKGKASVGYWVYVTLTFGLTYDLDHGCIKVKFRNSCVSIIVGPIDVKWKGNKIGPTVWACPLNTPMTLTLEFQEFEIALSQE